MLNKRFISLGLLILCLTQVLALPESSDEAENVISEVREVTKNVATVEEKTATCDPACDSSARCVEKNGTHSCALAKHAGQCPVVMQMLCPRKSEPDMCEDDAECEELDKCCSNGCRRVCVYVGSMDSAMKPSCSMIKCPPHMKCVTRASGLSLCVVPRMRDLCDGVSCPAANKCVVENSAARCVANRDNEDCRDPTQPCPNGQQCLPRANPNCQTNSSCEPIFRCTPLRVSNIQNRNAPHSPLAQNTPPTPQHAHRMTGPHFQPNPPRFPPNVRPPHFQAAVEPFRRLPPAMAPPTPDALTKYMQEAPKLTSKEYFMWGSRSEKPAPDLQCPEGACEAGNITSLCSDDNDCAVAEKCCVMDCVKYCIDLSEAKTPTTTVGEDH